MRLKVWTWRFGTAQVSSRGTARGLGGTLLALSLTAGASATSPSAYSITALGTASGTEIEAAAINNHGQIVGYANVPGGYHAFLWDSTGLHDLGDLGWPASIAIDINDRGQVIGNSNTTGNRAHHGFLWNGAGLQDLGTLGGGEVSPRDINDAGQIVGSATVDDSGLFSRYHPFLFSGGVMRDLGIPPDLGYPPDGNSYGEAVAINARGQVLAGFHRAVPPHRSRYYLWHNGVWQHLLALENKRAAGFGGGGEIFGSTSLGYPGMTLGHAFVYSPTGLRDLGTLGGPSSNALAMNGRSQVVGTSQVLGPPPLHPALFGSNGVPDRPFLFTGGAMHDLTHLLLTSAPWERFVPRGINNQGQIVGNGYTLVGTETIRKRAYLLTPHPTARVTRPAAPSGLSVRAVSARERVLTWTDNSSNEQSFVVERRHQGGAWVTVGTRLPNTTTLADTSVAADTRSWYRVGAANGAGRSAWSREASVSAPAPQPARPTNLRAVAASATRVNLTWQDNSSNETQFVLLRKFGGGLYQRIALLGRNTTGYTDTTVSRGVTYTYIMRALTGAEVSGWSNEASVTTP